MPKNNDKAIQDLLKKVEEQTKALGKPIKPTWNTNGVFPWEAGGALNINVCNDPIQLVYILGKLVSKRTGFTEAYKILGLDDKAVFKYKGYTFDEWAEDLQTRISIIKYNEKKKLLDASKAKLQSLMSEDARTETELNKLAELLK